MRDFFFTPLKDYAPYRQLLAAAKAGTLVTAFGMSDGQKAHLAAALSRDTGRPVLFIATGEAHASRCFDDLTQFLGQGVYLLTAREVALYHTSAASREITNRRVETLHAAATGTARVVVASVDSIQHRLMPKGGFIAHEHRLEVGQVLDPASLARALVRAGYEREERVDYKGQFAMRGGILDVFPPDRSSALRIEWFDDEIDSIRVFETSTQRSSENLRSALLPPAAELLFGDEAQARSAAASLGSALEDALTRHGHAVAAPLAQADGDWDTLPSLSDIDPSVARLQLRPGTADDKLASRVRRNIENAASGIPFPNMEAYVHLLYEATQTAADWMDSPIVVLDEPDKLRDVLSNRHLEFMEAYKSALERGEALPGQAGLLFTDVDIFARLTARGGVIFSSFLRTMAGLSPREIIKIEGTGATAYQNQFKELAVDLKRFRAEGWQVALLAGGAARGERLQKNLQEHDIHAACNEDTIEAIAPGVTAILPLSLSHGFTYPALKFAVIADADLYGAAYQKRRTRRNAGERIAAFTDLSVGDYVVHEIHGVGIYKGTVRLQSEGLWRDYLYVQYQGSDKLYVPTDQMDRVQRYIGADGAAPRVNKLGGVEWQRQKQKVKQSIRAMAFDLVKLYASRKAAKGYAFGSDSAWQRQFEDNFPFEETPDQLQAIAEIKADMESASAMDRLLCGDVGYGKTEVALRAAFKAAVDGKQVAILVPTTILAQQHYNTIKERFAGFPARFEVLSRFKTAAEQKEILQRLKRGEIDIVVGTHRLLGKDVRFYDLGLLIVDEEQRFGVQHKETIKNLRQNVDVLTLSATPIPRTLHMSMVGIRDMSLLETPPEERYPVQTYVVEYSDALVRDAITREIQRGGQSYVLYNRVDRIERFHQKLRTLVPEARIAIGHGQMREHVLEDVMVDFYEGKYDVLLCTTIIESGLDIPKCNTLIVCESDHFGLSQLYQLRGRVGRSNRLAYAYLTVPPNKVLTETADKRLNAIREFTTFGSGFRIAMRDLEIRGAGNLLGAEQHGFLSAVGYDMYCKLMEETVREIRGEMGEAAAIETRVEYPVDAFLPAEYVPSDAQRLELYKRIASVDGREAAMDLVEEITDRYGDAPEQVELLMDIALLKAYCNKLGIDFVGYAAGQVKMRFAEGASPDLTKLFAAVNAADKRLIFSARSPASLVLRAPKLPPKELLREALAAMEKVWYGMEAA
ncbi:MAG: transcription-repair coupling factor [Firmicutes bacterium]|nr:transcription-repair coupling factor [Bacillota bacterium]